MGHIRYISDAQNAKRKIYMEKTYTIEKIDPPLQNDNNPTKVCFVCTGNTCRSPMAAAILNHLGKGKYVAESAGIMASKGSPISANALSALKKAGIESVPDNNYEAHKARQLDMGIIDSCDKIVAVSAGHAMMIIQSYPLYASKITSLDKNISDPFGHDGDSYYNCLLEIKECIKNMFVLDTEE